MALKGHARRLRFRAVDAIGRHGEPTLGDARLPQHDVLSAYDGCRWPDEQTPRPRIARRGPRQRHWRRRRLARKAVGKRLKIRKLAIEPVAVTQSRDARDVSRVAALAVGELPERPRLPGGRHDRLRGPITGGPEETGSEGLDVRAAELVPPKPTGVDDDRAAEQRLCPRDERQRPVDHGLLRPSVHHLEIEDRGQLTPRKRPYHGREVARLDLGIGSRPAEMVRAAKKAGVSNRRPADSELGIDDRAPFGRFREREANVRAPNGRPVDLTVVMADIYPENTHRLTIRGLQRCFRRHCET